MKHLTKRMVFSLALACLLQGRLLADERVSQTPAQSSASAQASGQIAPAAQVPIDPIKVQEALRPLLKIAMQGDKSAPEQISGQITSLAAKTGNDPRLHYLHGLVLLRNFRHAEAIAAMQAGTDSKTYYFPIHHVLIYEQIRQKQYDAAIESLLDLSSRIGDPGQLWTSEVDRLEAARWLGRMVVYLAGPCGDSAAAELMAQAEPVIRSQLPPVYQIEMEGGANELHTEHRALQVQLMATVEGSSAKKASLLKEGEQKQKTIDTQRKELSTSAREQTAVQQEQLKELDGKLQALEKQYVQLQRTHDQILAAIASLRVQIATTPAGVGLGIPSGAGGITGASLPGFQTAQSLIQNAQANETARVLKEAELQGYVLELNQNTQKQSALLKTAESQLMQRQRLLSQLRSEDRRQQETADDLRRWQRRLSLTQKKVASEGDRTATAVKTRISQIATYDSINPQAELSQLTLSFSAEP